MLPATSAGPPTALNVTVDTLAPGAPAVASFSTDSGVVGDGITNDNTLTLTGTAAAGSTVRVFDGATQIGNATANGSGAWSFATATLTDGSHAFAGKALDAAGNVSSPHGTKRHYRYRRSRSAWVYLTLSGCLSSWPVQLGGNRGKGHHDPCV